MKIDGFQAQKIYESYAARSQSAKASDSDGTAQKGDRVEISSKAADMSEAEQLKNKTTEEDSGARASRVAEIKKLVESGEYSVPAQAVAGSILKGAGLDRRA